MEKFKVGGYVTSSEKYFLVVDTGYEQGIWAKYGLDPEFVSYTPDVAGLNKVIASGISIGIAVTSDPILLSSSGLPVKIVAGYQGLPSCRLAVNADGPLRTMQDLDGRKIGVPSTTSAWYRHALYLSNKFGVKPEFVVDGAYTNLTNQVVGLKLGRIDAVISCDGALLRLVDSGEIRLLITSAEYLNKPWTAISLFATEDLIKQNPDLVRRFVKAWLETVKYLEDNPDYAVDLYIKKTNAPRDLAEKVVSQINWASSGRGSGQDLVAAVANVWQFSKETGAVSGNINVKIEDVVDARFLP
ncbi:MAG: ABC transporter substrate-binding protein [Thaumarchaeota archaeon]|nr:ABC transporter substrate-binding protein [Nitrososphaerota archaeon]